MASKGKLNSNQMINNLMNDHWSGMEEDSEFVQLWNIMFDCSDKQKDAGCYTSDVFIHMVFWALLFCWLRIFMFPNRSFTFNNRIVSIVHAVVSFVMCTRCLFAVDLNKNGSLKWFSDFGQETTRCQRNTLIISMSYFIYDAFCVLIETGVSPADIIKNAPEHLHHIATIAGLMVGVYGRTSGSELTMCLWSMEITNPFLHGRTIMKEMEVDDPALSTANDIIFAVLFFLMRIVLGPVIVYYTFINEDTNEFVKLGGLAIQLLSIFWFYKIVKIAMYKSGKKDKGGKKEKAASEKKNEVKASDDDRDDGDGDGVGAAKEEDDRSGIRRRTNRAATSSTGDDR